MRLPGQCPVTGSVLRRSVGSRAAAVEAAPELLGHPPVRPEEWPACPVLAAAAVEITPAAAPTTAEHSRPMPFEDSYAEAVRAQRAAGQHREFRVLQRTAQPPLVRIDGVGEVGAWCQNDYLGMGSDAEVVAAAMESAHEYGAGSGGTRNISGSHVLHSKLETLLADVHGKDSAVLFSSCYAANAEGIPTIAKLLPKGAILFSDERNHASLIRGVRAAGVEKRVFKHNDVAHLEALLAAAPAEAPKVVVLESVYSMNGAVAPLEAVFDVAERYGAITMVDEVHAVGLYGDRGGGMCQELGLEDRVDIISGTLGKAFGVYGGYFVGRSPLISAVKAFCPGFIFTTSLPPTVAGAAVASVGALAGDRGRELRATHRAKVERVKTGLRDAGLPLIESPSHICPVHVGDASLCREMSDVLLREHGIYVQAINAPSVPLGEELFRLTPGPLHTDDHIDSMLEAMTSVYDRFSAARSAVAV